MSSVNPGQRVDGCARKLFSARGSSVSGGTLISEERFHSQAGETASLALVSFFPAHSQPYFPIYTLMHV